MHKLIFASLLLAHIMADYLFQGEELAKKKNNNALFLIIHALIFGILAVALTFPFLNASLLRAVIILILSHLLIDGLKGMTIRSWPQLNFEWEIADQFLHISILVILTLITKVPKEPIIRFFTKLNIEPFLYAESLLCLSGFIFIFRGATSFIRPLLQKIKEPEEQEEEIPGGRLIGNLERILTLIVVIWGQFTAMAFILAAKSICRFEELKNKQFSEYYLIGTLSSIFLAVVVGIMMSRFAPNALKYFFNLR